MKYTLVVYILFLSSCVGTSRKDMEVLVEEWMHKEIIFPNNIIFSIAILIFIKSPWFIRIRIK
jgi:hypothetical protein